MNFGLLLPNNFPIKCQLLIFINKWETDISVQLKLGKYKLYLCKCIFWCQMEWRILLPWFSIVGMLKLHLWKCISLWMTVGKKGILPCWKSVTVYQLIVAFLLFFRFIFLTVEGPSSFLKREIKNIFILTLS